MKYYIQSYETNQHEQPKFKISVDNVHDVTVYEDQKIALFEDNEGNYICGIDLTQAFFGRQPEDMEKPKSPVKEDKK